MDIQSLSPEDPRSLGRYELLGRLGRGAQGIVFLARDPANGTQVAVKLLRAHLDGDDAARLRFLREVAAAKRVAQFCTAQVLDANVAGNQPYIVSEYIPGPSLAEVIRSDGPRAGGALDRLAINTAAALGAIHHVGVVHRDFKAANVLLGPDGPVVIDFGVAKALGTVEQQLTLTGQQVGTPAYMAPEQFKDDPVGPETDIFAWGATMVFAATGTLPFGDGSVASVMYRILNEAPDLGGLYGPMRDLVAACLAKDPAARPTARQIVDRLMSTGNVPEPTAAEAMAPAQQVGDLMPGAGGALYTIDPLHNVHMRQDSVSLMPAGGPTVRGRLRGRPRVPRAALIATAVVIVLAGGAVVGLKAFASPGPHHTAADAVAVRTPTPTPSAKPKASPKASPASTGTSQADSSGVSTVSGANGPTSTTHYDVASFNPNTLAPVGETANIPYFEPVKGDWGWLADVHHCQVIGSNGTTEGVICLDLLEGNSDGGTTWYTPALTAYCQTISTGDDVQCANITGHFGMYSATGVQEAPKQYGWCGHSARNPCYSGKNYFVETDSSSWMTVTAAAADSCQGKSGAGTDCEIYPYAYAGIDIELPGTDKNVTLGANYKGADAIGY
ncbi:MAG: serine/threonine-protein kinase [Streptosporangiaceae bacterium]